MEEILTKQLKDINEFITYNIEIEVNKKALYLSENIKNSIIEDPFNVNNNVAEIIQKNIYNAFILEYSNVLSKLLEQINEKYNEIYIKKHNELNTNNILLHLFKEKINKYKIQNDFINTENHKYLEELTIIKDKNIEIENKFKKEINKLQNENKKLKNNNQKLKNKLKNIENIDKYWDEKSILYFKDSICQKCLTVNIKSINYINIESMI